MIAKRKSKRLDTESGVNAVLSLVEHREVSLQLSGTACPGRHSHRKDNGLNTFTTSGLAKGDLLFYDWQGDGIIDHVGIQVGHGTDPDSGLFGDYTDQHSTNRFHSFWSLKPYNLQRGMTVIYLVRISSSN